MSKVLVITEPESCFVYTFQRFADNMTNLFVDKTKYSVDFN